MVLPFLKSATNPLDMFLFRLETEIIKLFDRLQWTDSEIIVPYSNNLLMKPFALQLLYFDWYNVIWGSSACLKTIALQSHMLRFVSD